MNIIGNHNKISGLQVPVVLDVTLRDGGYLNNWNFNEQQIETAIHSAETMGADIIEIGYLDDKPGLPITASWPPELLNRLRKKRRNIIIAAMVRPSVERAVSVLSSRKEFIDLARIPVDLRNTEPANRLSEICDTLEIPYTFNLTSVTCYHLHEIEKAAGSLRKSARIFYIADSRGALLTEAVAGVVGAIKEHWAGPVGYHAHNNLGLAIKNTEEAINCGCSFIDGSICGIGLGGRNLNLKDALRIAGKQSYATHEDDIASEICEENLGVNPPADEMSLFTLSGERNIKMEWVQLMYEQLGLNATAQILQNIPYSNMFDYLELKPYIDNQTWQKIRW